MVLAPAPLGHQGRDGWSGGAVRVHAVEAAPGVGPSHAEADHAALKVQLQSQVLDQRATLASARADYEGARLEAEAQADLAAEGIIPAIEFRRAELAAEQLKVRLEVEQERVANVQDSVDAQLRASSARLEQLRRTLTLREQQLANLHVRAGGRDLDKWGNAGKASFSAVLSLMEKGVDLTRVVIGHSGDTTDLAYLEKLIDNGSYIGMDRFGVDAYLSFDDRVQDLLATNHPESHAKDTDDFLRSIRKLMDEPETLARTREAAREKAMTNSWDSVFAGARLLLGYPTGLADVFRTEDAIRPVGEPLREPDLAGCHQVRQGEDHVPFDRPLQVARAEHRVRPLG